MKKKINDRHRKMQIKQQRAEENRRKSQEAIKIREAEGLRQDKQEIFDYEADLARNSKICHDNVEKLCGVETNSEDSEIEAYYDYDIIKTLPKSLLFDFVKSICRCIRVHDKKREVVKKNIKSDAEHIVEKVELEFLKVADQIVVKGNISNNYREVYEVGRDLVGFLQDTVVDYLPEVKEKFRNPSAVINNIDSYDWHQIEKNFSLHLIEPSKAQNNDCHA